MNERANERASELTGGPFGEEERMEVARSRAPRLYNESERAGSGDTPDWIDKGRRRKIKGRTVRARRRDHPSGIKLAAGEMLARP